MDQFFQEVASTILVPLVSALVTAGVAFLVARISEVLKDMKEKKVAHHLMIAVDTIASAVEMVNQTFVDDLKEQGMFSRTSAEDALHRALKRTNELLPEQTKKVLDGAFSDVDLWIKTKTEEFVAEGKKNREAIGGQVLLPSVGTAECERQ